MTVRLYVGSPLSDCPPLYCGMVAPQVSEEECSYASCFYHWFLESSKSCLIILVALPGLIDTLAQLLASRALLWLSMTWQSRYLTQSNFFSTTLLAWSLALHSLFCFSRETHTQHTLSLWLSLVWSLSVAVVLEHLGQGETKRDHPSSQ